MMKRLTVQAVAIVTLLFAVSACGSDDVTDVLGLDGNEYLIKMDGVVIEEGESPLSGIVVSVLDDNEHILQASVYPTLIIEFDISDYEKGNILNISMDDDDPEAVGMGVIVLNSGTADEDMFLYVALSGTLKIVSKKRVEFNMTCYKLSDLDDEGVIPGSVPFVLTGYITENSPV